MFRRNVTHAATPAEGLFLCRRCPRTVRALLLAVVVAHATFATPSHAAEVNPADVKTVAVHPAKVALTGSDDAAQLVVTGTLTDGRLVDLTSDASYAVSDGKSAAVLTGGRVVPRANGTSEVVVTFGTITARVPLAVKSVGENLPINFTNQIVPIFTKLGCNSGGCHGKLAGQNGFRLSLLGFEPELDFIDAGEGRPRPAAVPRHPGREPLPDEGDRPLAARRRQEDGARLATSTSSSAAGSRPACRAASENDPTVTKISVFPEHRVLTRQSKQQFAVYAHYSDGTRRRHHPPGAVREQRPGDRDGRASAAWFAR